MGAVTMKMIRRTSITSTSGVTLICDIAERSLLLLLPISIRPPLFAAERAMHDVQKFGREAVHLGTQHSDLVLKMVVPHDRRNGGDQADGGGDQRLGDPGCHDRQGSGTCFADSLECSHNPPDRAEQADERGSGTGGGKESEVHFQPGYFRSCGPAQGAGNVVDPPQIRADYIGLFLLLFLMRQLGQFAVPLVEKNGEGRVGEAVELRVNGVKAFGLPEEVHEPLRLEIGAVHLSELVENDGPRDHREVEENGQYQFYDQAGPCED